MCMVHQIHFTMLSSEKLKQHFSQVILFTIPYHNTDYEERYFIEFKRDYYLKTKYDLEVQIPHIGRLADHNRKRYRITQHRVDWIKVSLFCHLHLCLGIITSSALNNTHHLMPSYNHSHNDLVILLIICITTDLELSRHGTILTIAGVIWVANQAQLQLYETFTDLFMFLNPLYLWSYITRCCLSYLLLPKK